MEIYGLTDPSDGSVRYIGKSNDRIRRFKDHLFNAFKGNAPVYAWIRKLRKLGLQPGLVVLKELKPDEDWKSEERRLISEYRSRGEELLNVSSGGNEPTCPIKVRIENGIRVAKHRRKRFWYLKLALGNAIKNGNLPPEIHAKLIAAGLFPSVTNERIDNDARSN